MPNQNTPQVTSQVEPYTALDVLDAHTLAHEQLNWLGSLLTTIKKNIKRNDTALNDDLLDLAEFLANTFSNHHDVDAARYKSELENQKSNHTGGAP